MKRAFFIFTLSIFAMCFISNQSYASGGWTGNQNFLVGIKSLDEDDWADEDNDFDLSKQNEFGFNFDFGQKSWPVHFDLAYLKSIKDDDYLGEDVKASTSEIRLGAKMIFKAGSIMRPYIGGGLAIIKADIEESFYDWIYSETEGVAGYYYDLITISEGDRTYGAYINTGIYLTIASHLNLGIDLSYSKAKVEIYNVDLEAGGAHALVLVGYHW